MILVILVVVDLVSVVMVFFFIENIGDLGFIEKFVNY